MLKDICFPLNMDITEKRFDENLDKGTRLYVDKYLNFVSLTPKETILVKCAYCIYVAKGKTLPSCPDKSCPSYRFMISHRG